jgi:hypothetical protein
VIPVKTYLEVIKDLQPKHTWISSLADAPSLDEKMSVALRKLIDETMFEYDPQQFEGLLDDVSRLLDKCLAYRREHDELVGNAIRQALEYELFNGQREVLEELDAASWIRDISLIEAERHRRAVQRFDDDTKVPLAAGFSSLAQAAADVSVAIADAEQVRQDRVHQRWALLADYQWALELRHSTPGHPLNFAERAERVEKYLLSDLVEAFAKATAAVAGTNAALGIPAIVNPLNAIPDNKAPLDAFIHQTRRLIQLIEMRTQGEWHHETHHTLENPGLGMEYKFSFGGHSSKTARLQSVGASLILRDAAAVLTPEHIRAGLSISVKSPFSVPTIERRSFELRDVSIVTPHIQESFYSAWPIYNLPGKPSLSFTCVPLSLWHPNAAANVDWNVVASIQLCFTYAVTGPTI